MKIPTLVAHRGYPNRYPENTLIGISAAVAAGARYVEVDIQLSKDRQPVLFHDRNLFRMCNDVRAVHELSLDQLQSLTASEPSRFADQFSTNRITSLPDLVNFLQSHNAVNVFIEIKRISIEIFGLTPVVEIIMTALTSIQTQCIIISYDIDALFLAKKQGWQRLGAVVDDWQQRGQYDLQTLQPEFLFCDIDSLPGNGPLNFENCQLAVYETVKPDQAIHAAKLGINYVETFSYPEMQQALDKLY